MAEPDIVIIGAGWAGLSAAVQLSKTGHSVTVLESARQPGGRARNIPFNKYTVDNGQHLLIGAYKSILTLLDILNIDEHAALIRKPLNLSVSALNAPGDPHGIKLNAPRLPAPLHLLAALITARGLGLKDRIQAMQFGLRLYAGKLALIHDTSVTELLVAQKQTARTIETFWEPLCLATLNTPMHEASAEVFLQVLNDAFLKHQQDADLLIPRHNLGKLLPEPAMNYIEQHGGHVRLGQRVSALDIQDNNIKGLYVENTYIAAKKVILAASPHSTLPLLKPFPFLDYISHRLSRFQYEPVTTVYLQYPKSTLMKQPMQGVINGWSQWVFDRRICDQPGLMAVVISSRGEHMQVDKTALTTKIQDELAALFPHWPEANDSLVVREKRATFSCHVDINQLRPENATAVNGLWLAGDYTATGYPATLEGAVRSGLQCAADIIQSYKSEKP